MSPVTHWCRAFPNRLWNQRRFLSATVIMSHSPPNSLSRLLWIINKGKTDLYWKLKTFWRFKNQSMPGQECQFSSLQKKKTIISTSEIENWTARTNYSFPVPNPLWNFWELTINLCYRALTNWFSSLYFKTKKAKHFSQVPSKVRMRGWSVFSSLSIIFFCWEIFTNSKSSQSWAIFY